jgi:hypothetical protein
MRENNKPPYLAIITGAIILLLGSFALLSLPPLTTPDAITHWQRTIQVAAGGLMADRLEPNKWGGQIDTRAVEFGWLVVSDLVAQKPVSRRAVAARSAELSAQPYRANIHDFSNAAIYSFLPYTPQALGYALGGLAGLEWGCPARC